MLGNQLRNADAQNSELKERVESLTKALEEATSLLQETTKKYEKLREQLSNTTATAEKLLKSNQDLKRMV
jgi:chromosome segregation ATPase